MVLFFAFSGILAGIIEYEISYFDGANDLTIWMIRIHLLSVSMISTFLLIFALFIRYLLNI